MTHWCTPGVWRPLRAGLAAMLVAMAAEASADMSVDGTRFIYPASEKSITLTVGNTGSIPILVQSWLDKGDALEDPTHLRVPFVLMPSLVRLEPRERRAVQLRYTGEPLPRDRESQFWVNFAELPASGGDQQGLRVLLNLAMKVLYRPTGLPGDPGEAPGKLRWTYLNAGNSSIRVTAENPTPYSVTFRSLRLRGSQGDGRGGFTVQPFSSASFVERAPPRGARAGVFLDYESVDDLGLSVSGQAQAAPGT